MVVMMSTVPTLISRSLLLFVGVLLWGLWWWHYASTPGPKAHSPSWAHARRPGDPLVDDVMNATLGFGNIFVLSLPERTDHRDGLTLAASLTGLKFDFLDAAHGEDLTSKANPPNFSNRLSVPAKGSWRTHINALSEVVHRNLATALILEDDADWDIRIKQILHNAAISTNAALQWKTQHASQRSSTQKSRHLTFDEATKFPPPQTSPYGDDWDVIWVGTCGAFVDLDDVSVLQYNDPTVPEPRYFASFDYKQESPLTMYPNHTRWVGTANTMTCSQGYAVSLQGARKLLYELGIMNLDIEFDLMLRRFCDPPKDHNHHLGPFERKCLTLIPQVFEQYRAPGKTNRDSDIKNFFFRFGQSRDKGFTTNIRWSTRLNMEKILSGDTDYTDQWPDS